LFGDIDSPPISYLLVFSKTREGAELKEREIKKWQGAGEGGY
jgi:hypothetical protein